MSYLQLIRSYTRYLAYAVTHSFFSGLGQTFLIALFVPHIRSHFSLENTEFGLFYSLATLLASFLLPFAGRQIDNMNLRVYSFLTGFTLIVSIFVIGSSGSLVVLFVGMIGLRLTGQSLMGHIASTTMSRYFGSLRGKALGISSLGHPLGEAIFPLFVAQLILSVGWRSSFFILGTFCAVVFFPLTLLLIKSDDPFVHPAAKKEEKEPDQELVHHTRKEVLKTPFFYFVMPLAILPPFLATGFFFHQGMVAAHKGWSMEWIATGFVGFAMFRIIGSFLIGPVIDRYSARAIYWFHLTPMAVGLACLALWRHPLVCFAYLGLMGLGTGFEMNIKSALWAEVYGTKHLGAIRSMTLTIMIFSTAISPVLFGWLLDQGVLISHIAWGAVGLIGFSTFLASLAPAPKKFRPSRVGS